MLERLEASVFTLAKPYPDKTNVPEYLFHTTFSSYLLKSTKNTAIS